MEVVTARYPTGRRRYAAARVIDAGADKSMLGDTKYAAPHLPTAGLGVKGRARDMSSTDNIGNTRRDAVLIRRVPESA